MPALSNEKLQTLFLPDGPYVLGSENALLAALARNFLTQKPDAFPVLIQAGSGQGKSHFLGGLLFDWQEKNPKANPLVLTAEDYARQFAGAVQSRTTPDFRNRLVAAPFLALENVERLASKPAAQNELRQILDLRAKRDAPTVITVTGQLLRQEQLDAGLRDRMLQGFSLTIEMPGLLAREGILRNLAIERDAKFTDEAIKYLAAELPLSPVALHAHFMKIYSGPNAADRFELIDLPRAEKFLAELREESKPLPLSNILTAVAKHFAVPTADLRGRSRRKTAVAARGVFIFLARTKLGLSYAKIGKHLAGRDHATILHAFRKMENQLACDPELEDTVKRVLGGLE